MSYPTVRGDAVEGLLYREAQMCLGTAYAGGTYQFFLTGTLTPANVYQDGALATPFPITGYVVADSYGRFPPIYLDPSVIYRFQLYDATNTLREDVDPYTSQLSTVGTSALSAYGLTIAPTGEITLAAPNAGGTGVTLTLNSGALGSYALAVSAPIPGASALIINSSATTGAQTASFQANNKPGTPPTAYGVNATVAPAGGAYVGGNISAAFTGPTASNYTLSLSTGQNIYGCTFTNGSVAFTTPSTVISGTPTTTMNVESPVVPAGWLPITCDGVAYYTPIWHGNNFTPYVANPSPIGEAIVAASVLFAGNGLTTATGGTASPGSWYTPNAANIGGSYDIKITKTGGLSGVAFSTGGAQTPITTGGLTITSGLSTAQISGTYQLIVHGGSTVVASGTINLTSTTGVLQTAWNGATPLVLDSDGTATLNAVATTNWYNPTTAGVGTGRYIKITQTGGTPGYSFSAATSYTQIGAGLTIGISGPGGQTYSVTGTYIIATDVGGVNQVGTGSITLTGGTNVQSPNWSGTKPLALAGNGSATLNSVATSSWYSPNAANVGSGYWINITRTSGTSGVNFSKAQGAWTNITNSGITIDLTGYTGDVGTVTVGGTYQISSSSGGTPVLGSGTISLSFNNGTVIHVYTTGSAATETIPTGTTTVKSEIWGSGGGAGSSAAAGGGGTNYGGFGGCGGFSYSAYTAAALGGAGKTFKYTVTAGGAGNSSGGAGTGGTAGTITAGTVTGFTAMTANGGAGGAAATSGHPGANGAGGTASGGNQTNTTGSSGTTTGTTGTVTGDGSPYAGGGNPLTQGSGQGGAAVFYYS